MDPDWLRAHVRPAPLPSGPSEAWYEALASALREGALGERIAASPGPVAALDGPDYVRVLLGGEPTITAVVRRDAAGATIDRVGVTTCSLCPEPVRFVRDLLADVGRRRSAAHRLLPGVELHVAGWLAEHPHVVPHHWLEALQARNVQGGELAWRLGGAEVVAADGPQVTLALADGTTDRWTVRYLDGRWQVDYAALPPESPLRLPPEEVGEWRRSGRREAAALHRWSPSWHERGGGLEVGHRAVGAAFDRDGNVLVAVLDLDRVLAGVFRVDPARRAVLDRWAVPPPGPRTPIPLGSWFERWRFARSPDGHELALTVPSRVWRVDTRSGETRLALRADDVAALAWTREGTLLVAEERGDVHQVPGGPVALGYRPVWVGVVEDALWAVTADGAVRGPEGVTPVCPAEAAALRPDGSELLVACAPGEPALANRVALGGSAVVALPGTPVASAPVSWSPDGRWFTTGAPGEDAVLLWAADEDRPVASFGSGRVRQVAWSPDGSQVLTVGVEGRVHLWDVHALRRFRGL